MPWQGDLFIGEVVGRESGPGVTPGALAIYRKLGIEPGLYPSGTSQAGEPEVFSGKGREFSVTFRGEAVPVYVYAMWESETQTSAVAFHLTGRYRAEVLDRGPAGAGRPDPFEVDVEELADVLQVREWWPEARVLLWDRFH